MSRRSRTALAVAGVLVAAYGVVSRLAKRVLGRRHSVGEAVLLSDRVVVLASNPGRVVEVLPIDLPRPRTVETIREPRYLELTFRARGSLGVTA